MMTPLPQTPGDRREDHAQAVAAVIAGIYEQVELILIATTAALARKVAAGTMTRVIAARRLRQTADTVFSAAAPRIRAALDDAMTVTGEAAREAITGTGIPAVQPVTPSPPLPAVTAPVTGTAAYTQPLAGALDGAGDTATAALQDALAAAADAADKVTAELPAVPGRLALPPAPPNPYQSAVSGAMDRYNGWPGSTLSYRRIQAAQDALDDLANQGITGFTDKAGRNWDLATYVEMATRTAVSNAWDEMQNAAMLRAGIDLAQIGTHSTEGSCPHCRPWLGRVISLSGATPGYPTYADARAEGWRHPNCRCFAHPLGAGIAMDVTNPVPVEQAAAVYKASQEQRALERRVRTAGRRAHAAITPQARARARRDLAAARAASAAHRQRTGLRMMKVSVQRRERPFGAR